MVMEIDTAFPHGVCSLDEDGQEYSNKEACRIPTYGHQGEKRSDKVFSSLVTLSPFHYF